MPSVVRLSGPSARHRLWSAWRSATLFLRKRFMSFSSGQFGSPRGYGSPSPLKSRKCLEIQFLQQEETERAENSSPFPLFAPVQFFPLVSRTLTWDRAPPAQQPVACGPYLTRVSSFS